MESALRNPFLLDTVFKNLDLSSLKVCREVCRNWSAVATPLFNQEGRLCINERPNYPKKMDLHEDDNIPEGHNYKLFGQESSNLVQLLNEIDDRVKSLKLEIGLDSSTKQTFSKLESLSIDYQTDPTQKPNAFNFVNGRQTALKLSEILDQMPNIKELEIRNFDFHHFLDTLFGPEGQGKNDQLKKSIESLTISASLPTYPLKPRHFQPLRDIQLRLKTLNLTMDYFYWNDDGMNATQSLFLWFQDLSPYLESLIIQAPCFRLAHSTFLSPMNKLRSLTIRHGEGLRDKGIIPLLNQLPVLEHLTLHDVSCTVVTRTQVETYDGPGYPNLKELQMDGVRFSEDYCPPFIYVPKLFPNLKILSCQLHSNLELLSCIYEMKGTFIEELDLTGIGWIPKETNAKKKEGTKSEGIPWAWGFEIPSFNSWKKLRQLKLSWNQDEDHGGRITHAWDTPLESILPRSLTSLQLNLNGREIPATFLIKLLQGLPLLMELKLKDCPVVSEDGSRIKRSTLINQIRNEPSINPYLNVSHSSQVFIPEVNVIQFSSLYI